MATVFKPDGTFEKLENYNLDDLQKAVGGLIAGVRLVDDTFGPYAYVNDEGLLIGMPINLMACKLSGQHIVGPMVVLTQEEFEDEA